MVIQRDQRLLEAARGFFAIARAHGLSADSALAAAMFVASEVIDPERAADLLISGACACAVGDDHISAAVEKILRVRAGARALFHGQPS